MPGEENFQIRTGMNVIDRNDQPVGNLENILAEDQTGRSRFIAVNGRLLPVESIQGIQGDRIKLTVPNEKVNEFPPIRQGTPSEDEQRKAYDAIGMSGPTGERP